MIWVGKTSFLPKAFLLSGGSATTPLQINACLHGPVSPGSPSARILHSLQTHAINFLGAPPARDARLRRAGEEEAFCSRATVAGAGPGRQAPAALPEDNEPLLEAAAVPSPCGGMSPWNVADGSSLIKRLKRGGQLIAIAQQRGLSPALLRGAPPRLPSPPSPGHEVLLAALGLLSASPAPWTPWATGRWGFVPHPPAHEAGDGVGRWLGDMLGPHVPPSSMSACTAGVSPGWITHQIFPTQRTHFPLVLPCGCHRLRAGGSWGSHPKTWALDQESPLPQAFFPGMGNVHFARWGKGKGAAETQQRTHPRRLLRNAKRRAMPGRGGSTPRPLAP